MKPDFNKRYGTIALYAAGVVFLCIFAVFSVLHLDVVWGILTGIFSVLTPILLGAMLAYVLCPIVRFFETRVFYRLDEKKQYRLKRVLSVISMFILVILFLLLMISVVIPAVMLGYADLQIMSGMYVEVLKEWLRGISFGADSMLTVYFETFIGYAIDLIDKFYGALFELTPDVTGIAAALVSALGDVLLGIILSIYFLFSKEKILAQFKKMVRAFLSRRKFGEFERSVGMTNEKFGGFLKGQVADALIIGTLSYICLAIIGVPYYPLVSVLVGIAALIPVFGLLIGTLIGAMIIFLADPYSELWFVLFMVVLYFVNKLMIRPKLMHTTVDASSVFMLTAIVLATGFVGVWGLVFGVPLFAVLYAFMHSLVNRKLEKQGVSAEPFEYYATRAGKELYLEREAKHGHRKDAEIFQLGEDDDEDPVSLRFEAVDAASDLEFPQ